MSDFPEDNLNPPEHIDAPHNNQEDLGVSLSDVSLSDVSFLSFFMAPQDVEEIFSSEPVDSNESIPGHN